jgi:hypothetical protein
MSITLPYYNRMIRVDTYVLKFLEESNWDLRFLEEYYEAPYSLGLKVKSNKLNEINLFFDKLFKLIKYSVLEINTSTAVITLNRQLEKKYLDDLPF